MPSSQILFLMEDLILSSAGTGEALTQSCREGVLGRELEQKHSAGMSLVWNGLGNVDRNGLRSLRENMLISVMKGTCRNLPKGREGRMKEAAGKYRVIGCIHKRKWYASNFV